MPLPPPPPPVDAIEFKLAPPLFPEALEVLLAGEELVVAVEEPPPKAALLCLKLPL